MTANGGTRGGNVAEHAQGVAETWRKRGGSQSFGASDTPLCSPNAQGVVEATTGVSAIPPIHIDGGREWRKLKTASVGCLVGTCRRPA